MRVLELQYLPAERVDEYVEQIGMLFFEAWSCSEPDYETRQLAIDSVKRQIAREPMFVAIDDDGVLAGVASIGVEDYYPGFCAENGVEPEHIGRDLYVVDNFRGCEIDGLKVWEHLLRARLRWAKGRGSKSFVIFADNHSTIELVSVFRRNGARFVRDLNHRVLGSKAIAMLEYRVEEALRALHERARFRRRRAGIGMRPAGHSSV
jgi:GNAT superfamily N-acetyltransferase